MYDPCSPSYITKQIYNLMIASWLSKARLMQSLTEPWASIGPNGASHVGVTKLFNVLDMSCRIEPKSLSQAAES